MTLRRTSTRRSLGIALLVALPFAAAGCGAGRNTTTDQERATPYSASARSGAILVTSAWVLPAGSAEAQAAAGSSPTPSPSASSGSSGVTQAYLALVVANSIGRSDTLTGVTVRGGQVDMGGDSIEVAPRALLRFGDPEVGDSTEHTLTISDLPSVPKPGTWVTATFSFQTAGNITLDVPVKSVVDYGTTDTHMPVTFTGGYPSASPESQEP